MKGRADTLICSVLKLVYFLLQCIGIIFTTDELICGCQGAGEMLLLILLMCAAVIYCLCGKGSIVDFVISIALSLFALWQSVGVFLHSALSFAHTPSQMLRLLFMAVNLLLPFGFLLKHKCQK